MKYKYFIAEGPQKAFEKLWNSICGKKPGCSWEDNPCVRAVEFEIKEAHMPNKDWEVSNTDQHGQQITEQVIQWVEWDGDVEHLPPEQTRIFYKTKSELDSEPVGMIGKWEMYAGQPCLYFWRCAGKDRDWEPKEKVFILLQKGDQFAVVA